MHAALMVAGWLIASVGIALGAVLPVAVAAGVVFAGVGVFFAGWDLAEQQPPSPPAGT